MCFRILQTISKGESDSVQDCESEGPNLGATYSSYETDSTTEEEDTELKATTQQHLTKTGKQLTLQTLPRSTKKDSKDMEGEIGILVHGPSCLGPRALLFIIDNPRESVV